MAPYRSEVTGRTITCREIAEWASAYLDGRVSHDARTRMDAHVASCAGCRAYVNQIELVRKTLRLLPGPVMESAQLNRLREAFAARWRD